MITRSHAYKLRELILKVVNALTDAEALEGVELFQPWEVGKQYSVDGIRYRYGDKLYTCVQAHTSQSDYTPDITPALWKEVSVEEFPEWVQPTGAQDAYRIGDKVSHNSKHWENTVDYNIYEPGVYGWNEVS